MMECTVRCKAIARFDALLGVPRIAGSELVEVGKASVQRIRDTREVCQGYTEACWQGVSATRLCYLKEDGEVLAEIGPRRT